MATMTDTGNKSTTTETPETTKTEKLPAGPGHMVRRVLRGIARGIAVILAVIVGLAAAGATYEAIAAGGDAKAYPPRGRLVDVGGYRLHIDCVGTGGTGTPTVVLDAGLGAFSLIWDLVQEDIPRTIQVCSYDRAGMGWSDTGPQPRTPAQIARELHTLLTNAGIPGPYVLVGHSIGGKNVRMFALQYPNDVAGMVLVDARSEYVDDPTHVSVPQAAAQGSGNSGGGGISLYGVLRGVGLVRLVGPGPWGPSTLSDRTRMEMALLTTGQRGIDATDAEGAAMTTDNAQLAAAPSLGERPLIVLAADETMKTIPRWAEAQRQQAAMSTNSRLVVVEGSSHNIQIDKPAVVTDAVQQVVTKVRGH